MKKAKLRGKPSSLQEFGDVSFGNWSDLSLLQWGLGKETSLKLQICDVDHIGRSCNKCWCQYIWAIRLDDVHHISGHAAKEKNLYESWMSHVLCWSFWRWLAQSLRMDPFPNMFKSLNPFEQHESNTCLLPPPNGSQLVTCASPIQCLQVSNTSVSPVVIRSKRKKVAESGGPLQHVFIWPLGMFPSPNMKQWTGGP